MPVLSFLYCCVVGVCKKENITTSFLNGVPDCRVREGRETETWEGGRQKLSLQDVGSDNRMKNAADNLERYLGARTGDRNLVLKDLLASLKKMGGQVSSSFRDEQW